MMTQLKNAVRMNVRNQLLDVLLQEVKEMNIVLVKIIQCNWSQEK